MIIAWVNNCIGHENLRFFLLFILYLFIGLIYFLTSIICIWNHRIYNDNLRMMSFLVILDIALIVVLFIFNVWNWFLAFSGLTTIELLG